MSLCTTMDDKKILDKFISNYNSIKSNDILNLSFKDISTINDISDYIGDFCFITCRYIFKSSKLIFSKDTSVNLLDESSLINSIVDLFKDFSYIRSVKLRLNGIVDVNGFSVLNFTIISVERDVSGYKIDELGIKLNEKEDLVNSLKIELGDKDNELNTRLNEKEELVNSLKIELGDKDNEIISLKNKIDGLGIKLNEKEDLINSLKIELGNKDTEIVSLKNKYNGDISYLQDNNDKLSSNFSSISIRNSLLHDVIKSSCNSLNLNQLKRVKFLIKLLIFAVIVVDLFLICLISSADSDVVGYFYMCIFFVISVSAIYVSIYTSKYIHKLQDLLNFYINEENKE